MQSTEGSPDPKAQLGSKLISFLKHNEAMLKSFILSQQPPSKDQMTKAGPTLGDSIGTYTPVDPSAAVQSSDVALFCTRIDRALEYSIDEGSHQDLYGVFTPSPEDASKFLMEAFSIVDDGLLKVEPMIDDFYKWEPIRKRMISSRVKVLVALSMVSPAIRDRCDILQRDLQSILLEDKRSIKCMMMYVDIVYEATLKHINTEFDRDVFYNVIARRKFSTVERKLRKNLWDYDEAILANLVSIIDTNFKELKNLNGSSERTAFESTLKILTTFLNEMHPLVQRNIRLDPQFLQNDVKVYINTLVKAYVSEVRSSDPLTDHFTFLTDASTCQNEKMPTKFEILTQLFDTPSFTEKQKLVATFVKSLTDESRSKIQNGLKGLVSRLDGAPSGVAIARSVRFLIAMLDTPDASVTDLLGIAMSEASEAGAFFAPPAWLQNLGKKPPAEAPPRKSWWKRKKEPTEPGSTKVYPSAPSEMTPIQEEPERIITTESLKEIHDDGSTGATNSMLDSGRPQYRFPRYPPPEKPGSQSVTNTVTKVISPIPVLSPSDGIDNDNTNRTAETKTEADDQYIQDVVQPSEDSFLDTTAEDGFQDVLKSRREQIEERPSKVSHPASIKETMKADLRPSADEIAADSVFGDTNPESANVPMEQAAENDLEINDQYEPGEEVVSPREATGLVSKEKSESNRANIFSPALDVVSDTNGADDADVEYETQTAEATVNQGTSEDLPIVPSEQIQPDPNIVPTDSDLFADALFDQTSANEESPEIDEVFKRSDKSTVESPFLPDSKSSETSKDEAPFADAVLEPDDAVKEPSLADDITSSTGKTTGESPFLADLTGPDTPKDKVFNRKPSENRNLRMIRDTMYQGGSTATTTLPADDATANILIIDSILMSLEFARIYRSPQVLRLVSLSDNSEQSSFVGVLKRASKRRVNVNFLKDILRMLFVDVTELPEIMVDVMESREYEFFLDQQAHHTAIYDRQLRGLDFVPTGRRVVRADYFFSLVTHVLEKLSSQDDDLSNEKIPLLKFFENETMIRHENLPAYHKTIRALNAFNLRNLHNDSPGVLSYLKIRSEGLHWNERFKLGLSSQETDKKTLMVGFNNHNFPYYEHTTQNIAQGLAKVDQNSPLRRSQDDKQGISDEEEAFTSNDEWLILPEEPYQYNMMLGPFTRVFGPSTNNEEMALNCPEIIQTISEGKSVFLIGYGASGAGKTSTLVCRSGAVECEDPGVVMFILRDKRIWFKFPFIRLSICELVAGQVGQETVWKFKDILFAFSLELMTYVVRFTEDSDTKVIRDNIKTEHAHISLETVIQYYINVDRRTRGTTNNPSSSRSHVLVFINFRDSQILRVKAQTPSLIIGDFAGVENEFRCNDLAQIQSIYNSLQCDVRGSCKRVYSDAVVSEDRRLYSTKQCGAGRSPDDLSVGLNSSDDLRTAEKKLDDIFLRFSDRVSSTQHDLGLGDLHISFEQDSVVPPSAKTVKRLMETVHLPSIETLVGNNIIPELRLSDTNVEHLIDLPYFIILKRMFSQMTKLVDLISMCVGIGLFFPDLQNSESWFEVFKTFWCSSLSKCPLHLENDNEDHEDYDLLVSQIMNSANIQFSKLEPFGVPRDLNLKRGIQTRTVYIDADTDEPYNTQLERISEWDSAIWKHKLTPGDYYVFYKNRRDLDGRLISTEAFYKKTLAEAVAEGLIKPKTEHIGDPLDNIKELRAVASKYAAMFQPLRSLASKPAQLISAVRAFIWTFYFDQISWRESLLQKLKAAVEICRCRTHEGRYINKALLQMREAIRDIILVQQSGKGTLRTTPPFLDVCLPIFCSPYDKVCMEHDVAPDALGKTAKSLSGQANGIVPTILQQIGPQGLQSLKVAVFTLFFMGRKVTQDPPPPYIFAEGLRAEYIRQRSANVVDSLCSKLQKHGYPAPKLAELKTNLAFYGMGGTMKISETTISQLQSDIRECAAVLGESLAAELRGKILSMSAQHNLESVRQVLNVIDNVNAVHPIGTLQFADSMAKYNLIDKSCVYTEALEPAMMSQIHSKISGNMTFANVMNGQPYPVVAPAEIISHHHRMRSEYDSQAHLRREANELARSGAKEKALRMKMEQREMLEKRRQETMAKQKENEDHLEAMEAAEAKEQLESFRRAATEAERIGKQSGRAASHVADNSDNEKVKSDKEAARNSAPDRKEPIKSFLSAAKEAERTLPNGSLDGAIGDDRRASQREVWMSRVDTTKPDQATDEASYRHEIDRLRRQEKKDDKERYGKPVNRMSVLWNALKTK